MSLSSSQRGFQKLDRTYRTADSTLPFFLGERGGAGSIWKP